MNGIIRRNRWLIALAVLLCAVVQGHNPAAAASGTLSTVGFPNISIERTIAVEPQGGATDAEMRLLPEIKKALTAKGYTVDPKASQKLFFSIDVENTNEQPSEDLFDSGGLGVGVVDPETDLYEEDTAIMDNPDAELTGADVMETDVAEPQTGGGRMLYALHFFVGPPGGTPLWQGSVETVQPEQSTETVSRSMIEPLVDAIGKTVRDQRVPLEQ